MMDWINREEPEPSGLKNRPSTPIEGVVNCKILNTDEHKKKEELYRKLAKLPIVMEHSPTRQEQEWNIDVSSRIHLEQTYEQALCNLRYLKQLQQKY